MPDREQLLRAIATLERVGRVAATGDDPRAALGEIVGMVADQMATPLCSLYLLEPSGDSLVLAASTALRFDPQDPPRLSIHEGLVGLTVEEGCPQAIREASSHPRFKFLPETGEERFVSFLGVPIFQGRRPVGCLVVQTEEARDFRGAEVHLLQAVAHQVAALVDTILHVAPSAGGLLRRHTAARLAGTAAAPGISFGAAVVEASLLPSHPYQVSGEPEVEHTRLDVALQTARAEIERLAERLRQEVGEGEAALLDMQRLLLAEGSFVQAIEALIDHGTSAQQAIREVALRHYHAFQRLPDPYIKQRGADVLEAGCRLLDGLCKGDPSLQEAIEGGTVRVAAQVRIADILAATDEGITGFVQGAASADSHAALLARALRLPMVSGVPLGAFQEGDRLIVDGDAGVVLINPEPEVEGAYREAQQGPGEAWSPPCPADALPIPLRANVSVGRDLETARAHGAAGVGLYRSEYFFLRGSDGMGTEEEQYRLYSEPFRYFPSQPVTLRTLDLGGDKPFLPLSPVREANPLLGLRAVRLALQRPGVLRTQLRAMLRAAVHGHLRILFPMVTVAEELDQLRAELVACRKKLRTEGLACANEVSVGVMVEVPAVARAGDALFAKVDFISIGSNDLVQYALAVDRQSTTVAHLYQPLHPAVLRLIDDTVQAAHRLGRPVALCGELGTLPVALPALLALGVDELSVAPTAIPAVWDGLSRLRREACAPLRGPLLGAPSQAAVLALLEARFPELVDRRRLGGG